MQDIASHQEKGHLYHDDVQLARLARIWQDLQEKGHF